MLFDMHVTVAKTRVTFLHIFHVFSVWCKIRMKQLGAGRTNRGIPVNKLPANKSSTGPAKVPYILYVN